jgi:glycosyltransferase involved in cell wall biosynthesis
VIPGPVGWSQLFFPAYLRLFKNCDVLFSPAHYAPRFSPVPFVVTVHDLSYYYYPEEFLEKDLYKLKNWTADAVSRARDVICVSKTTKKDVKKWYGTPDKKLQVIYNGYEKPETTQEKNMSNDTFKLLATEYNLDPKSYILYVGTLQPRKNIPVLVDAFYDILKEYPDYKLVIAGKKGWLYEDIFSYVEKRNLQGSVLFPGFVSDEMLAQLYAHAACYVLPSLYEGFGIPILEAMSCGCPVIASYASSLPEVGGEACLYFDPQNPKELADKMRIILSDTSIRKEYVKKGKKQVQQFSWDTCGKETLEVLQNVSIKL